MIDFLMDRNVKHAKTMFGGQTSDVQDLINLWFPPASHPYRILERDLDGRIQSDDSVLEIGCGRSAPLLRTLKGKAETLTGVDLVDFTIGDPSLQLFNNDVADLKAIPSGSIDLAYSRSVMEHVDDIDGCYAEINRVLKTGGTYLFLTPNFWDYGALIGFLIPNRFHQIIVKQTEGRSEDNTFPTCYRSNTNRSIRRLAETHGFVLESFAYLGQYPAYLVFSRNLFILGSKYEQFLERHQLLHWLRGWILCALKKA